MNQQKKNHKILNQADKISLRYEHSNSVQGYEKQEHYNARYIASKQNYKETTEGIMQMEFLAHETASMDLCFNEMMNDRNKVLRTGANMLGVCQYAGSLFLMKIFEWILVSFVFARSRDLDFIDKSHNSWVELCKNTRNIIFECFKIHIKCVTMSKHFQVHQTN